MTYSILHLIAAVFAVLWVQQQKNSSVIQKEVYEKDDKILALESDLRIARHDRDTLYAFASNLIKNKQ